MNFIFYDYGMMIICTTILRHTRLCMVWISLGNEIYSNYTCSLPKAIKRAELCMILVFRIQTAD